MTEERRRAIAIAALRWMATHMEAVLSMDGPHEIAENDDEDAYLCKFFRAEAGKLRRRANIMVGFP